jgi:glucose-6-phosphate isomerase
VTFAIDPSAKTPALAQAHDRLSRSSFADALWSKRLETWTSDPATQKAIGNRLGWLVAIEFVAGHAARLRECAAAVQRDAFTDVVLLGMGGSSLAPEVLRRVVGVAPGYPNFRMLDSTDPEAVRGAFARAGTSLFVLASKSGTTIEPNVMAAEAQRRLRDAGVSSPGSRFIAITDQGTALHQRAQAEGFRDIFVNPSDIGGRYSALSFFGMVPAALMGIDVDALLQSARAMASACRDANPESNPGLALGALMASSARSGRDKLTLLLPERLEAFGMWVEQLVAESTGKHGKGVIPIAGEASTAPMTSDRLIVAMSLGGDAPRSTGGSMTLSMSDTHALGAEFFRWEVATAAAGFLLDINPFDEPNVQQAKDATRRLLDAYTAQRRLPIAEPHAAIDGVRLTLSQAAQDALDGAAATSFLRTIKPGDYCAVLAYLPPDTSPFASGLEAFRSAVGSRAQCATMLGYGPRYLHSTGQLHKGGPNSGVFVIVTAEAGEDLEIPGEPFSFGILEMAQGVGDFQSLDRTGRRAVQLHLPARDPALLSKVTELLVNGF